MGYDESSLTKLISASDVVEYVGNNIVGNISNIYISELKSKTFHLSEISKAPKQSWLPLAQLLIDKENTVSKIKNYVKLIKQIVDSIPAFMLPIEDQTKDRYIQSLCEIAIKSQAEASKRISVFNEIKRIT